MESMQRVPEPSNRPSKRRTLWRRRFLRMPHRYALMIAYWFAFFATVLFSLVYAWHSWNRYEKDGHQRLILTAQLVATATRTALDREASGLRFLALQLQRIDALHHPRQARAILGDYQHVSPEIASADLIAPSGQVVASTAVPIGGPLPSFRHKRRVWPGLRRAFAEPGLYIHRPLRDPLVGHWVIDLSDTVAGPSGRPLFLVATPIKFRDFEGLFGQLPLSSGLAVGILRNDFYMEAREPIPHNDQAALLSQPQTGILARTLKNHPRAAQGSFDGWVSAARQYRFGVFVRVPGYPLVAFADVPRSLWFRAWWRRQAEIPLIFLIGTLVFSGFAYRQVQVLAARWEAEKENQKNVLRELVTHDPLTGLLNRRGLYPTLKRRLARAHREGWLLAVGLLDIDDFKGLNDRYGHAIGDGVLQELAARLEWVLRGVDRVARLGGDEFVLLVEGLRKKEELDIVIARIKGALAPPFVIGHAVIPVRVSLGVTLYPLDSEDADGLIHHADQAMYVAKARPAAVDDGWAQVYRPPAQSGP